MASGLITFHGQLHTYSLLLLDNSTPKEVSQVFEKMGLTKQGYSTERRASEVATQFLRLHPNAVLTEKSTPKVGELYYKLVVPSLSFYCWEKYGSQTSNSFQGGNLLAFSKWTATNAKVNLHDAIDRVIKFTYKGGSQVGKQRIVKLKSVTGEGNKTLLKGWDVVQSTGDKPAYRSYRLANVVGDIEVIG